MKETTLNRLRISLEQVTAEILASPRPSEPIAGDSVSFPPFEEYARKLYASFFLKELLHRSDKIDNEGLIIGLLDYLLLDYLRTNGCTNRSIFEGLKNKIKEYKPFIWCSSSCNQAKQCVRAMEEQLGNLSPVNNWDWRPVVNVFERTEDPRHADFTSSVKSAKCNG